MTSEEKADHKRVQDRLRQGNRRAKSGSTSITTAPVNIIASRTMRPECETHQTCDKTLTTALAIAEAPPLSPVSAYRGLDTAIAGEARTAALRIDARTRANTIEPLSNPLRRGYCGCPGLVSRRMEMS